VIPDDPDDDALLLDALGALAAEDDLDPAWDAVAAGTLDASEVDADAPPEVAAAFAPLSDAEKEGMAARILEPSRRRRTWPAVATVTLAAAAALLFLWLPHPEPLPRYELQLSPGAQTLRSAEPTTRFRADDRFEVVLRPLQDAPHARISAFRNGQVWDVRPERAASGAHRFVGPAGELLPLGPSTLVFLIDDETFVDLASAPSDVQRLEVRVERVE